MSEHINLLPPAAKKPMKKEKPKMKREKLGFFFIIASLPFMVAYIILPTPVDLPFMALYIVGFITGAIISNGGDWADGGERYHMRYIKDTYIV